MQNAFHATPTYEQPRSMSGFGHIHRYWDKHHGFWAVKILPGEFYVTKGKEAITTVLGSCISVCIRDPLAGVGGMNHFMLPASDGNSTVDWGGSQVSSATRYGNWAMEYMINAILKEGGKKERLETKVFGGGQVLANMTDIGQRNILFALTYLESEGFKPSAVDVGDVYPRRVIYLPWEGRVRVKRLASRVNHTLVQREQNYMEEIMTKPDSGDIELFD